MRDFHSKTTGEAAVIVQANAYIPLTELQHCSCILAFCPVIKVVCAVYVL